MRSHAPSSSKRLAGLLVAALVCLVAADARAQFVLIDDFESLAPGDVAGQRSWSSTADTSFEVATDPTDAGNQILTVLGNGSSGALDAYNDDANLSIAEGTTGTLFFRFHPGGPSPHVNLGLSDLASPGAGWSDFEVQTRNFNDDLDARDGGGFENLEPSLVEDEWYSVWMIVHNDVDQWEIHIRSDTQFPTQTQLTSGADALDFRNGAAGNDLLTFFIRSDGGSNPHAAPFYFDDLYLDQGQPNLTDPTMGGGGPPQGSALLVVEDVFQVPATSGSPPLARINVLREPPDGSGRLFVNDLRGPLYVWDDSTLGTYMDLAAIFSPNLRVSPGLASGFVSFAFHPGFATNGLFYSVHSEFVNGTPNFTPPKAIAITQHSVLTEWDASDPSANVFSGTSRELMRIAAPHHFHNLQEVAFNPYAQPADPDYGLLYLASGDFGTIVEGDPDQLQRLDTVYSAVLRIDPLGTPFMRGGTTYDYGIPPGNPYVDGDPTTLDEIFAHGFRNGHRLVWDPAPGGALYLTDIGEDNREEINLLVAGRNYGWPFREGTMALDPYTAPNTVFALPPDDATYGYTYPVAEYDHTQGQAIAGGLAIRDPDRPLLDGRFVTGDIVTGRLWYAELADLEAADDGDPATTATLEDLSLEYAGQETSLLQVVRDAVGDQGIGRTDLRLHVDRSGTPYATTKQDGFVREVPEPLRIVQLLFGIALLFGIRRRR